jgi:hypothetical protein
MKETVVGDCRNGYRDIFLSCQRQPHLVTIDIMWRSSTKAPDLRSLSFIMNR